MSDPADRDPASDLEPAERDLALRLSDERVIPAPGFRGALGRHLAALDPGYGPRLAHLRAAVGLCLAGGGALIAVGALQAMGAL